MLYRVALPTALALLWLGCDSDTTPASTPKPEAAEPVVASPSAAPDSDDRELDVQPAVAAKGIAHDLEDPDRPKPSPTNPTRPIDPVPADGATLLTIEARTPAVTKGKLTQNVGPALPNGRVVPMLATGCVAPCWQPLPIWPKTPEETSVGFTLYRGRGSSVDGATKLGAFQVDSVPKPKPGTHAEVVVGVGIVDGKIVAHATLRATGAALPLRASDK